MKAMEGSTGRSEIRACSHVTCQDHTDLASKKPLVVSSKLEILWLITFLLVSPPVVPSRIFIPQMSIREYLT